MDERLDELAREFLEQQGFAANPDGVFVGAPQTLLLDYYEGCVDSSIRSAWSPLADARSPMLALERELPRMRDAYVEQLAFLLSRHLQHNGSPAEHEAVLSYLTENLHVSTLPEDWLKAPVRLNLGLTVDRKSYYTLNVTHPAYDAEDYDKMSKGRFDESSIMWLTRRQGYKQADLRRAQYAVVEASELDDPLQAIPSRFLYSAAMEIWHELCTINQLGFFIKVPLRELLVMWTMQHWGEENSKWPGYILLPKETRCGFFSTMRGSGSLLGIKMERDVKVPLCDVDVMPDGMSDYSLYGVYDSSAIWKPNRILHWGIPRQLRRDAAKLGLDHEIDRLP